VTKVSLFAITAFRVRVTVVPDTATSVTVGFEATPDTVKAAGSPIEPVNGLLIIKVMCVLSKVDALDTMATAGSTVTVKVWLAFPVVGVALSVTSTVKPADVVVLVGVPLIVPFVPNVKPTGSKLPLSKA
jgi:hypothetical protein